MTIIPGEPRPVVEVSMKNTWTWNQGDLISNNYSHSGIGLVADSWCTLKLTSTRPFVKKVVWKDPVSNTAYSSQNEVPGNPQGSHFSAHLHDCPVTTMFGVTVTQSLIFLKVFSQTNNTKLVKPKCSTNPKLRLDLHKGIWASFHPTSVPSGTLLGSSDSWSWIIDIPTNSILSLKPRR